MAYRRKRRPRRLRGCQFCAAGVDALDYKNTDLLKRFISDRGKILPRRKVHACAKHQRRVARCVKRARQLALLPYTDEHIRLAG